MRDDTGRWHSLINTALDYYSSSTGKRSAMSVGPSVYTCSGYSDGLARTTSLGQH